ncbi:BZ3500_MvSof-1268-A1-R1_Chr10-1g02597 [Microbotryum saponariae]|uniref:BZ3500_MvSof-1268-A1-R1_Chr10-1g02597 protein n=1 Tax=Microbotryum saponariae TaxID=289078 RepID=A0A2X0N2S6_9BASI|nr:BZ3500_MvSof-1268-A1-R1_Chr10-1g02597 [Microbotryum saponariae]SDA06086.1 BZ3501_MvSof-1269-A2-R1_Chr10-1g02198 [Microbotryum saponariae]
MPNLNLYVPPQPLERKAYHLQTPKEEYDLNFVFPVPEYLQTEGGVRLVPLVPSVHAPVLFPLFSSHPSMMRYLPYTYTTLESFLTFLEERRTDPGTLLWVVYDLSLILVDGEQRGRAELEVVDEQSKERIAGMVGLLKCNDENRCGEVGSHINTHACSLLIRYLFDTVLLRRVCWFAHADNTPSVNAALRLGLKKEALLKWERCLGKGMDGKQLEGVLEGLREGEEKVGRWAGRDSYILGMGWDDWRSGGSELIDGLLSREVKKRTLGELNGAK